MNEILNKISNLINLIKNNAVTNNKQNIQEPEKAVANFSLPKNSLTINNTGISGRLNLFSDKKPESPVNLVFSNAKPTNKSIEEYKQQREENLKKSKEITGKYVMPALDVAFNLPSKVIGTGIDIAAKKIKGEPVSLPKKYSEMPTFYEAASNLGENVGLPNVVSKPISFIGELFVPTLIPFGFLKKIKNVEKYKDLLKESKTAEEAAKILKEAELPDEIVNKYAPEFAATKDINEVNNVLSKMTDELKSVSGIVEAGRVSGGVKQLAGGIPKELESLVEEARKYKSAEEFVVLSSKNTPRKTSDISGVYLTKDRSYAGAYANGFIKDSHFFKTNTPDSGAIITVRLSDGGAGFGDVMASLDYDDLKQLLIETGFDEKTALRMAKNPKKAAENIDHLVATDFMEREMGYSEIVRPEIKFGDIVKIDIYDNGKIIKTIKGGAYDEYVKGLDDINELDDYLFEDPEIYYTGTPYVERLINLDKLKDVYNYIQAVKGAKEIKQNVVNNIFENSKKFLSFYKKYDKIKNDIIKTTGKEIDEGVLKEAVIDELNKKYNIILDKDDIDFIEKIKSSFKLNDLNSIVDNSGNELFTKFKIFKQAKYYNPKFNLSKLSEKDFVSALSMDNLEFSEFIKNPITDNLIEKIMKRKEELGLSDKIFNRLLEKATGKNNLMILNKQEGEIFYRYYIKGLRKRSYDEKVVFSKNTKILPKLEADIIFNKRVGIFDFFTSPKKIFIKLGLYDNVWKPFRTAFENYNSNKQNILNEFTNLLKKNGFNKFKLLINPGSFKEISERIFRYLDGEKIALSKQELEIANYIRDKFDDLLKKINEVRVKQGLKPIKPIENYVSHIVSELTKYELEKDIFGKTANTFAELFPIEYIKNPTLLHRTGKVLPIEKDAFKAFTRYVDLANKSIYLDPMLKNTSEVIKSLPPDVGVFINKIINKIIGYENSIVERAFSDLNYKIRKAFIEFDNKLNLNIFSKKIKEKISVLDEVKDIEYRIERDFVKRLLPISKPISKYINKIRTWNYMSFIGLNIKVLFYNFITQPFILAPAHSEKSLTFLLKQIPLMAYSAVKFFSKKETEKYFKLGVINDIKTFFDTEIGKTSLLSDIALFNMRFSEFINRVSVYENYKGIIKKRIRKEFGGDIPEFYEKEAERVAKEFTDFINLRYEKIERPYTFLNNFGVLYYQYNSFSLKILEMLLDDLKKIGNKDLPKQFSEALLNGNGAEFLYKQGSAERYALLKVMFYSSLVTAGLSNLFNINVLDLFRKDELSKSEQSTAEKILNLSYKGFIPNQAEYILKAFTSLLDGDTYESALNVGLALIPPTVTGFEKSEAFKEFLDKMYDANLLTAAEYENLQKMYIPKNFLPAEVQIEKLLKGENISQKIGMENLPRRGSVVLPKNVKNDIIGFDTNFGSSFGSDLNDNFGSSFGNNNEFSF